MGIAGSPGWSESGGPWVKPQEGMKKYVWTETEVVGGKPFHGTLTHPPTSTGEFQDYVRHEFNAPEYYADAAVVAFRRPASDLTAEQLRAKITGSSADLKPAMLSDGNLQNSTSVKIPQEGQLAWIQYEYPQPVTIHALTIVEPARDWRRWAAAVGTSRPTKNLEASDDGKSWRRVVEINNADFWEDTIAFPAVTAKYI